MSKFILFNSCSVIIGLSSIVSRGNISFLSFFGVRFFSVLFLLMMCSGESWGQIAQFNFPATNQLAVTSKDANVSVSDIVLSAGTIETNITTGNYFPNEPYIEETAGWTADNQTASKNFHFTITATSGFQFSITNISFRAYATSAGPTVFGFAIGSNNIYSTNATDASLIVVNQSVSGQSGLTTATIKIQGWLNGSRTSAGGGGFKLDDVIIAGTVFSAPSITAPSPTSLNGFLTRVGTISSSQTFTIGGSNLTENLIVTPPENFEIRENGTGPFGSSVSFTPISGTVDSKTIEIRIAASASAGTTSDNVVCSSNGASSQNVWVSGTVTLTAPIATTAINPITMGFNANWEAVNGASEYKLDVSSVSSFMSPNVTPLVSWNFTSTLTATSGITENTTKIVSAIGTSTATILNNTARSDSWNGGSGSKYWEVEFATTCYSSCKVSSKQRSTSTGPKDFKLQYKVGAFGTYKDVNGGSITVADNYTTGVLSDILLSSDCDNQASVFLRWIMTSNTGVNGSAVTALGANNFDDIVITGNAQSMISGYNNLSVSGTSKFVMGLSANSSYYYRVRAVGGNSSSENSNTVTAITALLSSVDATTLASCPTCDIVITNSGTLNINAPKTFNSVTVAPGGKLTLVNGKILTAPVTLQSTALGTGTFVDENTVDVPTPVTGTVEQYLTTGRNWYVSMPVTAGTTAALSTATSVQYWNELIGDWATLNPGAALDPSRGYISVATNQIQAITFSGTLNSGKKEIALTRTTGKTKEGFNLVGNPYPSYLNWIADIATAANVLPSIWYRTKPGSSYAFYTYNADGVVGVPTNALGIIPPMQAFWVRANAGGGTLTFNNTMRTHGSGSNLLKAPAVAQPLLRLQVIGSLNTDEAVVYFNSKALNEYDSYDSPKMAGSNSTSEIYTLAGNEELVINGMKNYTLDSEIPLGFRPGKGSGFSIKASEFSNFDSNIHVFLKDAKNNNVVDITDTEYPISDATASTNRFSIVFKTVSTTTDFNTDINQQIVISKNVNNQITVNCADNQSCENSVTVHNAIGQKLITKKLASTSTLLDIPSGSGVYLVTVINAGNKITRKVILN